MTIKLTSLVELPQPKLPHDPRLCIPEDWKVHNRLLNEISKLEISKDRILEVIDIDAEELQELFKHRLTTHESQWVIHMLSLNLKTVLTVRGE